MQAMLVKADYGTGKRAGNIDPRSGLTRTHVSWQDVEKGFEVRVALDGNYAPYQNVPGITILNGEAEIRAVLKKMVRTGYLLDSDVLAAESIRQNNINIQGIDTKASRSSIAKELYDRGVLGVSKVDRVPIDPVDYINRLTKSPGTY